MSALPISAAVLNGTFVPLGPGTNVSLTAMGNLDWIHWGLGGPTTLNRKVTATPLIGSWSAVGSGLAQQLATNRTGMSWTDGTPTLAANNATAGVFIQGLANGFEITVAADTVHRQLQVYAGATAATGLLEALLSDASAPGYYDESLASTASLSNGVFLIDFAAASSGQTLTVRLTAQSFIDQTAGLISLQAAALASNRPPSVQLNAPSNNTSFLNLASITLTASANDSDGTIQRVEFYQNSTKLGEVFAPPYLFQWDGVAPGSYTLTARAFDGDGASTVSAPVAVTVQTNFAPTVALTNPANFASFSIPATLALAATASDIDGTVTKVEFFADSTKLGEATTSPYLLVWTNAFAGEYQLTARATDNKGATKVSSAVDVFFTQSGGYLTASPATVTDPVFLDAEGPADWAHWGLHTENSFDHKRGVVSQLGSFAVLGGEAAYPFSDNANTYSWADGTPTLMATNSPTGVYVVGRNKGFRLQSPAGVATNTLKVFVGAYAARGRLLAYLSDFSAPVISDFAVNNSGNGPNTVYTLQYAASAAGKVLYVRFLVDTSYAGDGNVTLQAAALDTSNRPPSATVTNPPDGATLRWPTNVTISVSAGDADGSVTNVEFFRDGVKLGQKASPPYALTWSNATSGSHSLSARAADNRGVTFTSRAADVFVSGGGGSLVVTSAFPAAQCDLSAEGSMDWTHWGLTKANGFDHRNGASTRISDATRIGNGQINRYTDNFTGFSWADGTPTPSASSSTTGIYTEGLSNGFQITAPADPSRRRLNIYVGLFAARGRLEASLSDNSARSFTDSSLLNAYGNNYRVYTVEYASASPGQQLVIRYTSQELFDSLYGNVTFQSASLVDLPAPRLLDGMWDGSAFSFRMATRADRSYLVQYSDFLPATNWQSLQTFPGNGADIWVTNSFPLSSKRFFRVMEY